MSNSARDTVRDTIAAIATAPGPGAVGIVRVSGPQAHVLAHALFRPSHPGFTGLKPRRLHHGSLLDAEGRVLDEVLAAFMPGPGSFTGEDTAEFFCHGGPAVLRAVLEELLARGARLARPGEFTLRAYLSGKLDLTQAEAVAEAIAAPTRAALHLAQLKLSGALSHRIATLREALESLRARLCLAVDFPEEDVECLPLPELRQEALAAAQDVDRLLAGVERARAWREGVLAVLAGRVNAGKSSLLNALVGRRRALVSATPGTTRDYLEEQLDLSGLLVRLVDTAGLRGAASGSGPEDVDPVEAEGQDLSRDFMGRAEAVLYVLDASCPLHGVDRVSLEGLDPARTLVVLNKSDLAASREPGDESQVVVRGLGLDCVRVSAKTGDGLEELCARLRERLLGTCAEPDQDEVAPNARQAAVLRLARAELQALAADAEAGLPYDILGVRLEAACRQLSELTGEIAPDEVLNSIFSKFCLGK
ncbi:MAG: tRNA uridine-5-carboxymethylaminomethyl(34) synthesis GTPase MnmE [Humidesulfovibrio sp.]|uniref:tRNA uridine-5-carboxymethylaminomethyl(34) synthesis GTPase MnmE n=1 Tax=Humidesulfovibrio sp. TaxID=2910988 RepID=UPI0027EC9B71|nr:tRNA uridine-5-carboxymethylaminomethyl(34) synthesis GTPase MnmE [Humidesulfovibrio sp.]MDQ7834573.1 tRNA uridine-5-carboxymethylaminomethyl(34) synthesis GTPase MnmE [Humidesulfovibrio sp.]